MNRKLYERECLIRSPSFRRDVERLRQQHPRLFDWERLRKDQQEGGVNPTALAAEAEALKAIRAKYPALDENYVSMVLQPAPFAFDPAWKVCVDNAVVDYLCEHEIPPRGLITRGGVEPPIKPGPEAEEVYERARVAFEAMPEEDREMYRKEYAPTIFRADAIHVSSEQVASKRGRQHLAARLQQAKAARYGTLSPKRAARRGSYENRLLAYDLVLGMGLTVSEAARRVGKHPRTFLHWFAKACQDIPGATGGQLTPEMYRGHVTGCSQCQKAEEKGRSDLYCPWMQHQLGARSGRIKGAQDPLDAEEGFRGRQYQPSRSGEEEEE